MIGTNFRDLIRRKTATTAATFTDADLVLLANVEKDDLSELITTEVGEDYFELTWQRDLVAGQREYTLMNRKMLRIKRLTAKLDGVSFVLLSERDVNQFPVSMETETDIRSAMMGKSPVYDFLDRGVKIYSADEIINVTAGLVAQAFVYPADITDTTLTSSADLSVPITPTDTALPRAAHKVWALRTSIAYKQSRPKPLPLDFEEQKIDLLVQTMIEKLRNRNRDRNVIPTVPYNDGTQY